MRSRLLERRTQVTSWAQARVAQLVMRLATSRAGVRAVERRRRVMAWFDALHERVRASERAGLAPDPLPVNPTTSATATRTGVRTAQIGDLAPELKQALDRDDAEVVETQAAAKLADRRRRARHLEFDRRGVRPIVTDPESGERLAYTIYPETAVGYAIDYFDPRDNSPAIRPALDDALRESLGLSQLDEAGAASVAR